MTEHLVHSGWTAESAKSGKNPDVPEFLGTEVFIEYADGTVGVIGGVGYQEDFEHEDPADFFMKNLGIRKCRRCSSG